jgi:hypothetical protein
MLWEEFLVHTLSLARKLRWPDIVLFLLVIRKYVAKQCYFCCLGYLTQMDTKFRLPQSRDNGCPTMCPSIFCSIFSFLKLFLL